jgi:hypothetical protein
VGPAIVFGVLPDPCHTEIVRRLAATFLLARILLAQSSTRGRLNTGDKPTLDRRIHLHGDDATMGVLADERLSNADFELLGRFADPEHFEAGPITSRSLFVHKDGKRLFVTYWCDVCAIRTYTPGLCVCCRKYTDLDLRESDE